MKAGELTKMRQWEVAWLKAKWHKDLIKDSQRENIMDEIRLNKKEGK